MTIPAIDLSLGNVDAGGSIGHINSYNSVVTNHVEPQRSALANWVSDLDFSQHQSQAYEEYTPETLLWVLKVPAFVDWLKNGCMLWAYGQPGAGKTVFASFVVNHLQNLPDLDPRPTVCYIYHRYHDTTRSTLQLFEAILRQLILRCPSMDVQRVQAARDHGERLTLEGILSILQETFNKIRNVFIVIDAFDECFDEATRHQVLLHLQALASVNILITSRLLPSIENAMGPVLKILITAHGEDIRTHFRAQKKINPTLKKLIREISTTTDVETELIVKADGRFLLAGLHIKNLAAQTSVNQLRHALDTLPQEVTASYEETMKRFCCQGPNQRQLAFHTLSWIFYALRPLSLIELRHALAIHNLNRMAEKDDLTDEESIISSCAGLVVVNRSRDDRGGETARVNFLHYTVQEFLQQARRGPDFLSEVEVALHSMKVISFPGIQSNPPNYPLIEYATSAWGPLVRHHEENNTVLELALSQLREPPSVGILSNAWVDTQSSPSGKYWGRSGATAIQLIAVCGLVTTMKAFIARTPTSINEKDGEGCTALNWTAKYGHTAVVKELLTYPHVDVNSRDDKYGRTALSWAALNGHLEVVKELIAQPSVDVDTKDRSGCTPLSGAAMNGHLEVARELLAQSNVNVNSNDIFDQTPLSCAASNGHLEVVKEFLIHPKVDIDPKTQFGRTPLSSAAINGHLGVVEEFLSHPDVDVNSKDEDGQTPLTGAAAKGHLRVIKALLNHPDVDVDSKDKSGQTLLTRAAANGRLEIVKEFITHFNVDVNSIDEYGCTPLSWAAKNGQLEVVKLLVNFMHVNINSKDSKWGHMPLQWAVKNDHFCVVDFLLDTQRRRQVSSTLPIESNPTNAVDYQDSANKLYNPQKEAAISNQPDDAISCAPKEPETLFSNPATIPTERDDATRWPQNPYHPSYNDETSLYPCSHSFGMLTTLQTRSLRLIYWLD